MKLTISSLTKRFGDLAVVDNVSLEVPDGHAVTLLGPSGCGKTTVLRMVAGLETPTGGEIVLGDRTLYSAGAFVPPHERGMGMVFQNYALWPHLTAADNIGFPLKLRKLPKEIVAQKTQAVLELVGLTGLGGRFPNELSGGQQQRVALARAIVMEPQVLLLDEPLSNLDAKLREQMRNELKALQTRLKLTVLYVTHDRLEALAISDHMAIMDRGKLVQYGTPEEIRRNPVNDFVAHFISS